MNTYEPSNDNIPAAELRLAERNANIQANIIANNEAFRKLGPLQKRVAIAKDVLAWLATGGFKATKATYVRTGAKDLQEVACNEEKCEACALGLMFAATAFRMGKTTEDFGWGPEVYFNINLLTPYFGVDELNNIENAFEGTWITPPEKFVERRHYNPAAVEFNKGVRSPRERMERIMRNIIRHGGRFIP